MLEQPGRVGGHRDRLLSPVGQTVQRPDAQASESGFVGPFRGGQAPIEIAFGPERVHAGVDLAVVGLLIHHQSLGAGLHQRSIFGRFHGADFE